MSRATMPNQLWISSIWTDMKPRTLPTLDAAELPESLRPGITAAAGDSERQGDIPTGLRDALRDAGAFRLLTPRELGGWEAPLTTVLDIYERFGHIDASVGLLVWNANFGFVGAMLDPAGVAQIWGDGTEPVFANSGQPGTAEPVDGGYRLSGEWKIVSGIHGADWVILIGMAPEVRFFAVRTNQVDVRNTWDVSGVRATGSNNVTADGIFVPTELTVALDTAPRIDRPLYRGFIPTLVFPGCTAVALGVAGRAIDEAVALVGTKRAMTGGTVADAARTQHTIAKSEAAVTAARLLLKHTAEELQRAGDDITLQQRAALRAAMTHAADVSRETLVALMKLPARPPSTGPIRSSASFATAWQHCSMPTIRHHFWRPQAEYGSAWIRRCGCFEHRITLYEAQRLCQRARQRLAKLRAFRRRSSLVNFDGRSDVTAFVGRPHNALVKDTVTSARAAPHRAREEVGMNEPSR